MRGILYIFIALTGTIAVIVFMTEDTLSYKTYKENGREIARLLEVVEEDDGTKTARILDFTQTESHGYTDSSNCKTRNGE